MLQITLPHVNAWNAWFSATGNRPSGVAPLRGQVDQICRSVGRDPAAVERTVAVLVRLPDATGARDTDRAAMPPLEGDTETMAEALRAYAREGIGHVQLIIDPITEASLERLAPVLERLDHSSGG
jgi:alkanesulfonate monooxygenase SsuD/methylene tetrahydromethanopterin reductase-like flavin-dependent oxidoreductase (luciferase family)